LDAAGILLTDRREGSLAKLLTKIHIKNNSTYNSIIMYYYEKYYYGRSCEHLSRRRLIKKKEILMDAAGILLTD
jgi:hypothetical protein